jgi:antitoxin ParD1/3/4
MSNVEKISIALPSEMIEDIKEAVDAGEYATTSEAIRDALRHWHAERVWQGAVKTHGLDNIRRKVQEGLDSLDRGEGIPAEELYAELTARYGGKKKGKKRA